MPIYRRRTFKNTETTHYLVACSTPLHWPDVWISVTTVVNLLRVVGLHNGTGFVRSQICKRESHNYMINIYGLPAKR